MEHILENNAIDNTFYKINNKYWKNMNTIKTVE